MWVLWRPNSLRFYLKTINSSTHFDWLIDPPYIDKFYFTAIPSLKCLH